MANYSLGSGVEVSKKVPYDAAKTFKLAKELLDDYTRQGLDVTLKTVEENEKIRATIRNDEGTDIDANIRIRSKTSGSEVQIVLYGYVHVGGVGSFFVSDSFVQKEAQKRLSALVDQMF